MGSGAIILRGVTIGKHAVIAAGSVVTKDVADYTIVTENSVTKIKTIKKHANGISKE